MTAVTKRPSDEGRPKNSERLGSRNDLRRPNGLKSFLQYLLRRTGSINECCARKPFCYLKETLTIVGEIFNRVIFLGQISTFCRKSLAANGDRRI